MMKKEHHLLVINVGSTSTKVGWFSGRDDAVLETIRYSSEALASYKSIGEQLPRREEDVLKFLARNGISLKEIDMIVSRGGLGKPAPAGAYMIDDDMCRDLLEGKYGMHPSALGPAMALDIARKYGMPAIVIDPPSTDEFQPLARISGLPEIERKSAFHALNQKMAARRLAREMGKRYEEMNLVVAHLGGGVTIGAHQKGRVIDCTHGLGGRASHAGEGRRTSHNRSAQSRILGKARQKRDAGPACGAGRPRGISFHNGWAEDPRHDQCGRRKGETDL